MRRSRSRGLRGFTVLELLVVIAIVAVIAGLLFGGPPRRDRPVASGQDSVHHAGRLYQSRCVQIRPRLSPGGLEREFVRTTRSRLA